MDFVTTSNIGQLTKYILPAAIVTALVVGLLSISNLTVNRVVEAPSATGIMYNNMVCKTVKRVDGTVENLGCSHNIFTNQGKNMTRDMLTNYTGLGAVNVIAVGNCTVAPTCGALATETTLSGEWTTCGLGRSQGDYTVAVTSMGNWTIQKQFTSTCNNAYVNDTALSNATSASSAFSFAIANFTTTTLQSGDQITITWYIWVT